MFSFSGALVIEHTEQTATGDVGKPIKANCVMGWFVHYVGDYTMSAPIGASVSIA